MKFDLRRAEQAVDLLWGFTLAFGGLMGLSSVVPEAIAVALMPLTAVAFIGTFTFIVIAAMETYFAARD